MMQQAREQHRTAQLEELRKTDPKAFGLMVLEFREKHLDRRQFGKGIAMALIDLDASVCLPDPTLLVQ